MNVALEATPAFGYALMAVGAVWLVFSLAGLAYLARRRPEPGRPIPYRPDAPTRIHPRVDR